MVTFIIANDADVFTPESLCLILTQKVTFCVWMRPRCLFKSLGLESQIKADLNQMCNNLTLSHMNQLWEQSPAWSLSVLVLLFLFGCEQSSHILAESSVYAAHYFSKYKLQSDLRFDLKETKTSPALSDSNHLIWFLNDHFISLKPMQQPLCCLGRVF